MLIFPDENTAGECECGGDLIHVTGLNYRCYKCHTIFKGIEDGLYAVGKVYEETNKSIVPVLKDEGGKLFEFASRLGKSEYRFNWSAE
jgi:protein-arginine kinase activator protein McsA